MNDTTLPTVPRVQRVCDSRNEWVVDAGNGSMYFEGSGAREKALKYRAELVGPLPSAQLGELDWWGAGCAIPRDTTPEWETRMDLVIRALGSIERELEALWPGNPGSLEFWQQKDRLWRLRTTKEELAGVLYFVRAQRGTNGESASA